MEMEGMEGAILIFMLGNMEQTVARKQTKREKNNTQKRTEGWKQKGIWLFWYAVVPVFAFYLMECYEHNPFAEVRVEAQLFNIFLFELIGWMLYFLTGRMCFASRVLYGLAVAFGITNHYVMKFRSTPFVPWDLFSAGTAASVAGSYDFTPDRRMVIVTLVFIALFVLTRLFKKGPRFSWKIRLGSIVLVGLVLCTFVNALQQESFQTKHYLYPFLFTPAYMTKVNGMAVTFAMDLAYVAVERPAGYDADEAKETLAKYETKTTETDTQDLPNIIVIMDEAFSDLKVLGPLETNEDYMPFMHRMQQGEKNTVTGYVQTSVCGGNTADSEFEFLTGNTMAFLPNGSIPYQQYIKSRTPSLAGYLKSLGYATYAQHPYQASGWNRDKVYPLLGFDNLDFMEDYRDVSYVRNYISDASDMEHIIETYEKNKASGKPAFIFNVTMQNHGGYTDTYMNLTNDIQSQYASEPLNQYLTLIHKTDQALENLIDYFSKVDDRTIIVFFGDHQPSLSSSFYPYLNGKGLSGLTLSELENLYTVPFFIWTNYDSGKESVELTSLNYLSTLALERAGIALPAYNQFLADMMEEIPAVNSRGFYSKSQGKFLHVEDAAGEDAKWLKNYEILQYNNMFDKRNKSELIFPYLKQ